MKDIAAIVYIPNKEALIKQFFGLYHSVMIHPELRKHVDFLVGCEPGMEDLFQRDNCIVTHTTDLSQDEAYQFSLMDNRTHPYINSWSHFADSHSIEAILNYRYALRIDVDTFISPQLLAVGISDKEILTGNGGYIRGQVAKDNILRVARALNMNHRGVHNIGSTWYATARNMVEVTQSALDCSQHLLHEEFAEVGAWPDWYAMVTTMYAGEIALNHSKLNIRKTKKLDAPSTSETPVSDVYTIHCWHTDEYFSKHRYADGKYDNVLIPENIHSCRDYSFLCARISEVLPGKSRATSKPEYLTAPQAMRTAFYLFARAFPMMPAAIKRKYFS